MCPIAPFNRLSGPDRRALEELVRKLQAAKGDRELRKLVRELPRMNAAQTRALRRISQAFGTPLIHTHVDDSDMVDEAFDAEFQARIQTHHALIAAPLSRLEFEAAFCAAALAGGHKVETAPPGTRFWDARVDDKQFSLKTTAEGNLSVNTLHISKLTEAAWIQDCRSAAARRSRTRKLIEEYTNAVDSIWQLRFFRDKRQYELVEIPVTLIAPVLEAPQSAFQAEGPQVPVPDGAVPPDLFVRLDRSDAKITLARIQKNRCTVHGVWTLSEHSDADNAE